MTVATESRTWTDGPKSYQDARGNTLWPKPQDESDPSPPVQQGAIYGKRSDGVICFRVFEVPNGVSAVKIQAAEQRAAADLETMLNCACTADSECPEHEGRSGKPKAVREGGVLPLA